MKNMVFGEMERIRDEWQERRLAHLAKKEQLIQEYGHNSPEADAWYTIKEEPYPFTSGESKAFIAWAMSQDGEFEMNGFLFDNDVKDFIDTLRRAGIRSFVYTNNSTAVMGNIHAFDAAGYKLKGLCSISRKGTRFGYEEAHDVQGLRFEDTETA